MNSINFQHFQPLNQYLIDLKKNPQIWAIDDVIKKL